MKVDRLDEDEVKEVVAAKNAGKVDMTAVDTAMAGATIGGMLGFFVPVVPDVYNCLTDPNFFESVSTTVTGTTIGVSGAVGAILGGVAGAAYSYLKKK